MNLIDVAAIGLFTISATSAFSATPASQFEVASVKANPSCGSRRGGGPAPSPGRVSLECQTVTALVMTAYGVFADGVSINRRVPPIKGGPDWIQSDTYDVAAKAEDGTSVPRMMGPMLRSLLEDRFRLRAHLDIKEDAVYFLTVAKDGPKLEPTKDGGCVPIDPNQPKAAPGPGQPRIPNCGSVGTQFKGSTLSVTMHGATMEQLAVVLNGQEGRPVIDKTGLTGRYEIQIEYQINYAPGGEGVDPSNSDASTIFRVLQTKLGLKLEAGKGPVETIVIDHVERPGEN